MMIVLLSFRNVWRNKIRSTIIMLSIAIGMFAGIAVLSLYKGMMASRIQTVIESEVGHIQIHHPEFKSDFEPRFTIPKAASLVEELDKMPSVLHSSPRSVSYGMLSTTAGSAGVQINGVIPLREAQVSSLQRKIVDGSILSDSIANEILIAKKLATKLRLRLRSKVVLMLTDTSSTLVSASFRVCGIFRSDNAQLDERNVYILRKDLNTMLTVPDACHEIAIRCRSNDSVASVHAMLKMRAPSMLIERWEEISPETDLMVRTVDQYSYIIMVIIMFALAFGIINTMLMAILERTREIGMMMALGTNNRRIFSLVLFETLFLTLAGCPVGILAGWIAAGWYNTHGLDLSGMGREMMSSFGFGTMIYPEFPADKLLGVLIIVACTAFVSCLFPAFKALKLRPVDALHFRG